MYYKKDFPSTTSESQSNGSLESALTTDTESPLSYMDTSSSSGYTSSPGRDMESSDSETPSSRAFRAVRSDNFIPTSKKTFPSVPTQDVHGLAADKSTFSPCWKTEPVSIPVMCASSWKTNQSTHTVTTVGGQLFTPVGGHSVYMGLVPPGQPYGMEFNGPPTSSSASKLFPSDTKDPDVLTISKRMLENHRGKYSERHQITTASGEDKMATTFKSNVSEIVNCIFEKNFAAEGATGASTAPSQAAKDQFKILQDADHDEEFELVLQNSTHTSPGRCEHLTNLYKNLPEPGPLSHKYEISFTPSTVEMELQEICDQLDRITLAHGSCCNEIKDIDILCQRSYDQYRVNHLSFSRIALLMRSYHMYMTKWPFFVLSNKKKKSKKQTTFSR